MRYIQFIIWVGKTQQIVLREEERVMNKKQWYAKSSYVLVALALVLSLGLVLAPAVSAATERHVGPGQTYTTITAALAAANDGDEIIVHPGTYSAATNSESFPLVVNDDNLVIRSTGGPPVTIIDAGGAQTNILEINNRDNVSVDGFTLTNASGCFFFADGKGIYMTGSTNCDISNMVIHNIHAVGCGGEPMGILADHGCDSNTFSSIEIYDITSPNTARGIYLRDDSDDNTFSSINIHDLSVTDNVAFGIHVNGKGHSCTFNEFSDITIERITGGPWAEGIELQDWSDNNVFADLFIKDVTAEDHAYGIKLGDSSDNMFDSGSEICYIDATCGCGIGIGLEKDPSLGSNRNTFESFDIHDTCYGFYIHESNDNFITKCNIYDNVQGVNINSTPGESVGNALHCNNIYGNADFGVYKECPPDVDATGNWWGDAHGPSQSPGNGDEISGNVAFDPYLSFQFEYCEQCGGAIPPPASAVPTVNNWGIVSMIVLFAGLLVWSVRRRRLAS
jgi:hypothetical protein